MTDIERLTVAQAVYNAVGDLVSTKRPGNLRDRATAQLVGMYQQMGVRSLDLRLNEEKVGTFSVVVSKATPERHERAIDVTDAQKALRWAKDNPEEWDEFVSMALPEFCRYVFEEYGEVPDGCEVTDRVTPAQPERASGTTRLKVDQQKVAQALQGQLSAYVAGLLEGGED